MQYTDKANKGLISRAYQRGIKTPRDFMILKNEISEEFKIDSLPNYGPTQVYDKLVKVKKIRPLDYARGEQLLRLLKKAKMRTLSGVAVVSVLTKEYGCPGTRARMEREQTTIFFASNFITRTHLFQQVKKRALLLPFYRLDSGPFIFYLSFTPVSAFCSSTLSFKSSCLC